MASVTATGSDVLGEYAGKIDASLEVQNSEYWLYFGCKKVRLAEASKAAHAWQRRVVMVPGIGRCFGSFCVI